LLPDCPSLYLLSRRQVVNVLLAAIYYFCGGFLGLLWLELSDPNAAESTRVDRVVKSIDGFWLDNGMSSLSWAATYSTRQYPCSPALMWVVPMSQR